MNLPKVGVPYAFPSDPPRTFDCWTLMTYLRGQLGLWTPSVDASWRPESIAAAIEHEKPRWQQVTGVLDGDAVLMHDEHIGLYLKGFVAHATPSTGVLYTPVRTILRRFPATRYFRPCL